MNQNYTVLLIFLTFLCSGSALFSQQKGNFENAAIVADEYIVQLSPETAPDEWLKELRDVYPELNPEYIRPLSPPMNIHLFQFQTGLKNPWNIRDELLSFRDVRDLFPNRQGEWRSYQPDDPLYPDQWNLFQIEAPEAWEIARGGTTALGDTIVIAIMDSGCQIDHPDLYDNIWVNRGEIPGSGMDEDGNGYIDDYYGLNITTGNDQHNPSRHGTEVIGAAAAVTNNGEGLSSINWNVKVMVLSKSSGGPTEADMVEAYNYAIDQRKRYNESNGEEGAFVVATNFSGGIANQSPDSFPLWCGMYDFMGEVGILSTAATVNTDTDVDVFGDVPTACPSPFLLSVTNSDMDDLKIQNAGYGVQNIELAAPGRSIPTTTSNSDYLGGITGTSLAAPQVTAAIALLYSADCQSFAQLARDNPSEAALVVRRALLDGVDQNPDLQQYTSSGGRLNVYNSLFELSDCKLELGPLSLVNLYPNPTEGELNLRFLAPDFDRYEVLITDMLGREVLNFRIQYEAFSSNTHSFRVDQLQSGAYLIHLRGTSRSETRKFIKY